MKTRHVYFEIGLYIGAHIAHPRGKGNWWFAANFDGQRKEFNYRGTFSEAKVAAAKWAKELKTGYTVMYIDVLP